MYKEGDLIKIDLTVQGMHYGAMHDRWVECPYVTVYDTQIFVDSVRIEATVYYPEGTVLPNSVVKANPLNSILIERIDNE